MQEGASLKVYDMDTLDAMRIFVRVVEARSFTAVGRQTNATTAQVSRGISSLEEHLKVRLLHRTTRHLSLTEAGQRYFEKIKSILAALDVADTEARNSMARPYGTLRIHSVLGLGQRHVTAAIVQYQNENPDVSVDLTLAQRVPNLVEEGYDLSVLVATDLPDSGYVTQTFGCSYSILVASPEYLSRRGHPLTPADLERHACLRLDLPGETADEWRLYGANDEVGIKVTASPFQANVPDALRLALRSGSGIGPLAIYSVVDDIKEGKLERVLPGYRLRMLNVYAVYPSRRYVDAKVRTFLEFLRATLAPALRQEAADLEALTNTHTCLQRT
jgi:DNA-binding transcriptional LysR family regulator